MSDITWIAILIIVYLMVIKPIMQGMRQKPAASTGKQEKSSYKPSQKNNEMENHNNDYVEYEEMK